MAETMPPRGYFSVLEGRYPASFSTLWHSFFATKSDIGQMHKPNGRIDGNCNKSVKNVIQLK